MMQDTVTSVGDLRSLVPAWQRSLRAANRAPKTLETYSEAARLFIRFLLEQGMPTEASKLTREHVETFIAQLLDHYKPATANNRYRALARLFDYLVEEGEITDSPMAKMKPPTIPDQQVPIIDDNHLRKLLAAAEGKGFESRRDTAALRLLIDSGMRASELVGLKISDLDLDLGVAVVVGRVDVHVPAHLETRRPRRLTATYERGPVTPRAPLSGCGSGRKASSPTAGYAR